MLKGFTKVLKLALSDKEVVTRDVQHFFEIALPKLQKAGLSEEKIKEIFESFLESGDKTIFLQKMERVLIEQGRTTSRMNSTLTDIAHELKHFRWNLHVFERLGIDPDDFFSLIDHSIDYFI